MTKADEAILKKTASELAQLPAEALEAALKAFVKAKRSDVPLALAAAPNKSVARAARKALYQLRSEGVADAQAPAPRPSSPVAAAPTDDAERELPAILSSILGTGERALVFALPNFGGGLSMYQCIVSEAHGIERLEQGETNRGKYRRHLKALSDDTTVCFGTLADVREELAVGLAENGRSKTPLSPEASAILRRLGVTAREAWPALPAPTPEEQALLPKSSRLHDEPEIKGWLPPETMMQILGNRLQEVDASPLALSPAQQAEQRHQKALVTAREFFTPQMRARYAHRLWRMAQVFDAHGRTDATALSRATAKALGQPGSLTSFEETLFLKVLSLTGPAVEAPAAPGQGLLVPP